MENKIFKYNINSVHLCMGHQKDAFWNEINCLSYLLHMDFE